MPEDNALTEGWFVAGYGPTRRARLSSEGVGTQPVSTPRYANLRGLYEDSELLEVVPWLKELDYKRLHGDKHAGLLLHHLLEVLQGDLLPGNVQILGVDPSGLRVKHRGAELSLASLSHGYQLTAAFIVDLVMRMHRAFGFHEDQFLVERRDDGHLWMPYSGVVLVDEMELHLHPSWQKKIGFWLKSHFPNVQFLVTTHSPFICQAADTLVRLSVPGEGRPAAAIVDEDTYRRVVGGGADDAVVSDLFGLEYPHSDQAERDREQLAELEAKELGGTLGEAERPRLAELQGRLPATPGMGVERVLRRIANDR